jgi:hypothetical protein
MPRLLTRAESRRSKSAKAGNRGRWFCSGAAGYGDLAAEPEVRRLGWSDCGDGFAAKYGWACRWGRAVGTLHEKTCEVTAGESSAPLRAWTVPAESQQE